MPKQLTVREFFKRFPNDDACLDHVLTVRFGQRHVCRACGVESTFHRITGRKAYACAQCGDHLYPCAGTIFQDSRTPLTLWFYAIYLFVTTRHGVSGKELERQLGVTYKTAYRMGQQIRDLMGSVDEFRALQGHVEIDETYVGGVREGVKGRPGAGDPKKTAVLGMKERGGPIYAQVIPDAKTVTLRGAVLMTVQPQTTVSTDEHAGYNLLKRDGYRHGAVCHSAKEWARTDEDGVSHHTNNVESFWWLFKRSIASTHIHVSQKHMERYLGEFTFRSNNRQKANAMFDLLIGAL